MCDPVSAGAALGIAGGGTSLFGSYLQAKSQVQAGDYNAKIADQNAQLSEWAGKDAVARGDIDASLRGIQGQQVIGEQRAAYAASGVDVNSGTPVNVAASTAIMSANDQAVIKNNAAREAWGYSVKASQQRQEGEMAKRAGNFGAAGTILGGVGNALGVAGGLYRGSR